MKRKNSKKFVLDVCLIALVCVVLFSLVACGQKEEKKTFVPTSGQNMSVETFGAPILTCDDLSWFAKGEDSEPLLSLSDRMKIYDFYHMSDVSALQEGDVFRDMYAGQEKAEWGTLLSEDAAALARPYVGKAFLSDYADKSARSGLNFVYKSVTSDSEEWGRTFERVTFFDGRKSKELSDGEVVVSRYAYYTLYVLKNGLNLDKETAIRVIRDEDVFAKYILLRNCGAFLYGFPDGLAFEYYGLDKQIKKEPIQIEFFRDVSPDSNSDGQTYRAYTTKTIVGVYDEDLSGLASHITDLNNMCGYDYDAVHTPGFYSRYLTETRARLNAESPALSDSDLLFWLVNGSAEERGFAPFDYAKDDLITAERKGEGALAKTAFVFGK